MGENVSTDPHSPATDACYRGCKSLEKSPRWSLWSDGAVDDILSHASIVARSTAAATALSWGPSLSTRPIGGSEPSCLHSGLH